MSYFFLIIPAITFPFFVYFAIKLGLKYEKKKRTQVATLYQDIATKFSLNFIPEKKSFLWSYKYPEVIGTIDGSGIHLYSYKSGGKNKTVYTDLNVSNPFHKVNFRIVKENFFSKIGKALGGQDIQIGHEELDKLFIFKCSDESLMRTIIDEEITAMLLHLNKDIQFSIEFKNSNFKYNFMGHVDTIAKKEVLEKILVLMLKILEKTPKN